MTHPARAIMAWALLLALHCMGSVAEELTVIDQSEQEQYWVEKRPLNFSWGALNTRLKPMDNLPSGTCFNASFIIDNAGAVQSVKVLKIFPEKYIHLISSLEKSRIWSKYRFTPAPQNSAKTAIRSNVIYYQAGMNSAHKDYIANIESACEIPLKQALVAQNISASVNMDEIAAKGEQEVMNFYSDYSCGRKKIDCGCARDRFLKQWKALGIGAQVRNIDFTVIDNACKVSVSDDVILAKAKEGAAKMRSGVCETNPAWKSYDCDCMEDIYIEEWVKRGDKGNAAYALNVMARRAPECEKPEEPLSQSDLEAEREEVLRACENNPRQRTHFKCACLADRVVEERKINGRSADRSNIIATLNNECKNTKAKAKNMHSACLKFHDAPLCACAAKKYEELYEQYSGKLNYKAEGLMARDARKACQRSMPSS